MRLIISDFDKLPKLAEGDVSITPQKGAIRNCIGCFGCWVKTPGQCVIHDGYENMGKLLSQCNELILISECVYGSLSPFVKNVLDRAISYIHPFFSIRDGRMHHKRRYGNVITISACFYGKDISPEERATAQSIIEGNAVNYDGRTGTVAFFDSPEEIGGILQ